MTDKILVVFTGKSKDELIRAGATGDWSLNPVVVRDFEYVVCTRHTYPPYDPGPGARPEAHHEAFLIAKIADIVEVPSETARRRYNVVFGDIADISITDFWQSGWRNPVRYLDMVEAIELGLNVKVLDFQPLPQIDAPAVPVAAQADSVKGLTIGQAKQALALSLGVSVDQIEITIKA